MFQEKQAAPEGYRLSPQQRRIWAERQRHGEAWQKTLVAAVVEGDLDPAALRVAMDELVERHEILRTRFYKPSGSIQPLQVIDEPALDWSEDTRTSAEGEGIENLLGRAWDLPVDPVDGPLIRASFIRLSPGRHLLVVTLPTIVSDSMGAVNLVRALGLACASAGEETGGEVLQYADLAEWQNELLESEEAKIGRAHWEDLRWRGLGALNLPLQRPETGAPFVPQRVPLRVDPVTAARLHEAATSSGASLRTFLLAGWQALLARFAGDDFAIGVEYDGRRYRELTGALGPFARCLPFPCRLDLSLPWTDLLARVTELDRRLSDWQESFAVDEAIDGPFSSVQFTYTDSGSGDPLLEGSPAFFLEEVRSYRERFALALEACHGSAGLRIMLHYDPSRLSREEVELTAARLVRLLESAASTPSLPSGSLEILPEAERLQLLRHFNPPAALPEAKCLHELFAGWAARVPDRTCLVSGDQRLSYRELNARSNRLARHLHALGAGPETRIAICLERSVDMVVALLAVLKVGAAYVPLDPAFPRERMASMLADSEARLLISQGALAAGLDGTGLRLVALDAEANSILSQPDDDLALTADPGTLAYVIFTSGSTGRPKGVAVEHRQLFQYVQGILLRLELPEGSSFATVSTLSADLGYTAVFPALSSGGCLHVIAADLATDPLRLAARFGAEPVDVLKITPSHLAALLSSAASRDLLPRGRLVLGGEALTWELKERIAGLSPDCTLFNHYGPTESTVGVCTFHVGSRAESEPAGTVPIGHPLAHAQIHLLDGPGLLVPLGTPGEIYIGGAGLARGYLGDPRLTAERFVPDPFGPGPGARLYRTGDRARRLPSGALEFLGRVDDQLKIRGFRVEPGEIEKLLEGHPAVTAARVVGRETSPGELQLVAYLKVHPENAGPVHRLLGLRADGRLRDQPLFDLPNGMTVAHLNEGETRFLFQEIFEERTYLRHGIRLRKDACVLDVGASIGLFSLLASRFAEGVRVFAFEPAPAAFRALRLNAEIHGGIQAFDFGLSRENRQAAFTFYPHLTLMSSLYADADQEREVVRSFLQRNQREGGEEAPRGALLAELLENRLASETVTVSLRRLSDVLREQGIDRVDLLKIDVQKSELDVLDGIDSDDWPKIRQITMEVHDLDGRLRQIMDLLEARGYEVVAEQERALAGTPLFDVYARRPETDEEDVSSAGDGEEVASVWSSPGILVEDLRRHLRTALPEYMVPSSLTLLKEFPLTPNGKLDRRALPNPEDSGLDGRKVSRPPATETEKKLAEIWSVILKGRRFGVSDSFFEIGGHSLLATQVVARIRASFNVEVTLRDFFNDPTVEGLARRIETAEPLAASTEERINRLVRAAYLHSRPPVD